MPRSVAPGSTTEQRRTVIVGVVERSADPLSLKQILTLLEALHAAGRWPLAEWAGARQDPYYVGVQQHVTALVKDGRLERIEEPGFFPRWKAAKRPLRKHAAEVLELQAEEGLNGVQIATRLGLSRSLIYAILNDPHGDGERRRKAGYCPGCGTKKDPDAAVCDGCIARKEKKDQGEREAMLPTDDEAARILDTFAEELRAGREAVLGVTPDFKRVIRWRTRRGEVEHVLRRSESWSDAMSEIGLWSS